MKRRDLLKGLGGGSVLGALAAGTASADHYECSASCCYLCTCPYDQCDCQPCAH